MRQPGKLHKGTEQIEGKQLRIAILSSIQTPNLYIFLYAALAYVEELCSRVTHVLSYTQVWSKSTLRIKAPLTSPQLDMPGMHQSEHVSC